ncbi:MAG TPA: alkaline phosphatase family protein [Gemmataceae bacterium]|nr:alkaline phosphatase family protein [Gemmataceae bacterium]
MKKPKQICILLSHVFAVLLLAAAPRLSGEQPEGSGAPPIKWPAGLPVYDHIVIVVEENKDYEQIIDNPKAPYINDVVRKEGANFTRMFGEEHDSEGNYFWMFSGSNQGVGFRDVIPTEKNNPNYPFKTPNLGAALIAKGLSFKGYSEDLPEIGSKVNFAPPKAKGQPYARKHVPWISFANVPHGNTVETSSHLRFKDFPTDPAQFKNLPTVAFVIPNQNNDMHNGQLDASIVKGDAWLKTNLDAYYQWAKSNNSLLIVTWDESHNRKPTFIGLTNPFVDPVDQHQRNIQNHIPTMFAGAHIKPGNYSEGKGITHVNILRTIEAMYGLPRAGRQQPNAEAGGIRDDYIITDVFVGAK